MGYALNQSSLYNLHSKRRLAKALNCEISTLMKLSNSGDSNYKQYASDCGRWIEYPLAELKPIQKRIHNLLGRLQAPTYLYSGFKGESAVTNAQAHKDSKCMLKMDIRKFYPSINGRLVQILFVEKFKCSADVAGIIKDITTIGKTNNAARSHLPTGGVTSPILAYFCYIDLFEKLYELSVDEGLKFTVLADDITFSGDQLSYSLFKRIRSILSEHNLQSHWRKEKFWSSKHTKTVTGVIITSNGCRVPNSKRKKITELRNSLKKDQPLKKKVSQYRKLTGLLSWAGTIEDKYSEMNKIIYQMWRSDKVAWLHHIKSSATRKGKKHPIQN